MDYDLLSLARMARAVGVTQAWLREQADAGRVLLNCRSRGCDFKDIVAAVGLEPKDLLPDRDDNWREHKGNGKAKRRIVETYDYHDADGQLSLSKGAL